MEVIRDLAREPFATPRRSLVKTLQSALKDERPQPPLTYSDRRSLFRFSLHTLPTEVASIGTDLDGGLNAPSMSPDRDPGSAGAERAAISSDAGSLSAMAAYGFQELPSCHAS
jgi:hypothetical protein